MSDFLDEANRIADEMTFNFQGPATHEDAFYAKTMSRTEWQAIERAAFSAHQNKHKVAEQWRIEGGYGGPVD